MPRYRFGDFVLSPRRRVLARGRVELPLIPRYFDLLVFLVAHRHEAVHRRDIFDRVWSDVIVSDSALSQAIRTIRRTLGDDSREPRFIRTVSRHGYRFVHDGVIEEEDDGGWLAPEMPPPADVQETPADPFEPLLRRLAASPTDNAGEEDQREAAELLHGLGTSEALKRLGTRPGHPHARALLRDSRWDVPSAGSVPFIGAPGFVAAAAALIRLRLRRAARLASERGFAAAAGGGTAGLIAGAFGGSLLALLPDSGAPLSVTPVLAAIGAACGAAGGGGVGAGMAIAESVARSNRGAGLVAGAVAGGGSVGLFTEWLGEWTLRAVLGIDAAIGGGLEGVVLGGAAGLAYALATRNAEWGLAAPKGRQRRQVIALVASSCALAALALTIAGRPLVGGTIHVIAESSRGAQARLTPLGRLVGEPDFGPIAGGVLGTGEGALFGLGLATGFTRRRRS